LNFSNFRIYISIIQSQIARTYASITRDCIVPSFTQ